MPRRADHDTGGISAPLTVPDAYPPSPFVTSHSRFSSSWVRLMLSQVQDMSRRTFVIMCLP